MTEPSNPPFASKLPPMCNAWVMLSEDDPDGTNYNSPTSAFQRLISERLCDDTTQAQFKTTFSAVGPKLRTAGKLLTMCPATTNNLDPETVSDHFDIIAFQMYSSTSLPGDFVTLGIPPDAFAYGAKFEAGGPSTPTGPGVQTATQAFQGMQTYGFKAVTTWRLNSQNYITEQDSQLALSKLVKGS